MKALYIIFICVKKIVSKNLILFIWLMSNNNYLNIYYFNELFFKMNEIETKSTFIDSIKNTWSYTKMDILFKEISKYWISKEDFINRFLEIYEEIESRYSEVFLKKWYTQIESFFDKFVSLATQKIIEIQKGKENELNFSIFVPKESKLNMIKRRNNTNNKTEILRKAPKYDTLLRVLHKKYWLELEWVEINTYLEALNKNRVRRLPYRVVVIKIKGKSLTIVINDQIWEWTYVYDWIIEPSILSNVSKWDIVEGKKPLLIKYYSGRFENNLDILFSDDFLLNWIKIIDYGNPEHLKILLSWNIKDKDWDDAEVNLRTIWVEEFSKLYFWYWTVFWSVRWVTILINSWWIDSIFLRKILDNLWIPRPDLPSEELDYGNSEHLKILLSKITDKHWDNSPTDLSTIWIEEFSNLYFWHWTVFWSVRWATILINIWWIRTIYLKRILENVWIPRPDLPSKELNYKNPEHIKVLLLNVTDKNQNKENPDLKTISFSSFSKLYFWYGTEFWVVRWATILKNNWWINNKSLKKILDSIWIPRPDL